MYVGNNLLEGSIYITIVGLYVIAIIRCIFPLIRIRRKLKHAVHVIRRGKDPDAWKQKTFLGRGVLQSHWSEYLRNRLFADEDYQAACSIDDYINEATAIDEPTSAAFSDAVPGLFVSLGFLGTLMGLTMGLTNIQMGSGAETMAAIPNLISGMRYAFTTSIFGIVASITYSLFGRAMQGSVVNALEKFYDAMRQHAGAVTVDPITQIAIYQQEQTAMMQDLTSNMTDRLGSVLEMALQPIQASLNDFITATAREQIKGIDLIVTRFISRMNESLKGQFDNLASLIDETCRWQEQTREGVGMTISGIDRVTRDIIQIEQLSESLIVKFDAYMTKLGTAQLQIDDGYAAVAANVKNMEVVARQQANYVAQIGQMQTEFKKDIVSFQTTMDGFTKSMVENTNVSTAALKKVSDELQQNGDVLNDAHKTFISGVNTELTRTFDLFDKNLGDITGHLGYVISSISETIERLPEIITQGADGYAREVARMTESVKHAQLAVEETLKRLNDMGVA